MPDKRIIDYNEAESLSSDDYLIIDGSTNGTRKIKPNQLQVATDKTLSIEDTPADAKAVGDQLNGVKADLNEKNVIQNMTGWEKGSFNSTNGTDYSENNYIRLKTNVGVSTGVNKITCDDGYVFLLFAWDSDGNFVGSLKTGKVFDKTTANFLLVSEFDCNLYPTYVYKVAMCMRPLSTSITADDGVHCYFQKSTDDSLSIYGKAADAKAVGDAIGYETKHDNFYDNSSWATGYLGTTTISTNTANGDKYTPVPIKVKKGEQIKIRLASTLQYFYMYYAWCNSSKQYSVRNGGSAKYTSSISGYYIYETTLTAPSDTYFIMSYRPGTATYEDNSSVVGSYSTSTIETFDERIEQNTSNITNISSKISEQFYYQFPDDATLPINVCHRGLSRTGLPENTLIAYSACKEDGWPWVESDIRKTSDGVWVMLHDATINRTARNADGTTISDTINIADITYEQALTYDFGIYAGQEYAGIKILTLDDFLNFCNKAQLCVQLEIKNSSWTAEEAASVWNIVEKYRMQKKCAWLGSSVGGVQKITNIDPYAPVVATSSVAYSRVDPADFDNVSSYWTQYKTGKNKVYVEVLASTFSSKELLDNYVDFCHHKGLYAGVYGVDTLSQINALCDRLDIVSGQYYKYNETKAKNLANIN